MSERILIVEDDPIFRSIIEDNLISEGYRVDTAGDGATALAYIRSTSPDLILLDLTLPDWDGLELCPLLRRNSNVSIIILSARSQKFDKLQGLRLGADDYIVKPTDMEELIARIKVVLRRTRPRVDRLQIGRIIVDFRTQRALCGRTSVRLTFHEFKLLEYLAQRPFQVVRREELLTEVWGYRIQMSPLARSTRLSFAFARNWSPIRTIQSSFTPRLVWGTTFVSRILKAMGHHRSADPRSLLFDRRVHVACRQDASRRTEAEVVDMIGNVHPAMRRARRDDNDVPHLHLSCDNVRADNKTAA